jgi:flagellar FliJ protein
MKKFKFRLQRVVEVREVKEKECQRELSVSAEELSRREKRLEEEASASSMSEDHLRKALKKSTNAGQLSALDGWRSQKERDVHQQHQRTEEQRGDVDLKRKALIQASKDKKVLERLRERRYLEHQKQQQTEEQAFLDELGSRPRSLNPNSKNGNGSEDQGSKD